MLRASTRGGRRAVRAGDGVGQAVHGRIMPQERGWVKKSGAPQFPGSTGACVVGVSPYTERSCEPLKGRMTMETAYDPRRDYLMSDGSSVPLVYDGVVHRRPGEPIVAATEPKKIGQHEWRIIAYELRNSDGDVDVRADYQWRPLPDPSYPSHPHDEHWEDSDRWPSYDWNRSNYGLPLSIKKLDYKGINAIVREREQLLAQMESDGPSKPRARRTPSGPSIG